MIEAAERRLSREGFLHGLVRYTNEGLLPTLDQRFLSVEEVDRVGREAFARSYREANSEQLYFTKRLDWESEEEYRFAYLSNDRDARLIDIHGCLAGVCLGARFPPEEEGTVLEACDREGIPLYRLVYSNIPVLLDVRTDTNIQYV